MQAFSQEDKVYAEACENEIENFCLQAYQDIHLKKLLSDEEVCMTES